MSATLQQLEALRDSLIAAMGTGTQSVRYGDKQVSYQPLADMKEALGFVEAQIAELSGSNTAGRCTFASTSRV